MTKKEKSDNSTSDDMITLNMQVKITPAELNAAIHEGVFVLGLSDGEENTVGHLTFLRGVPPIQTTKASMEVVPTPYGDGHIYKSSDDAAWNVKFHGPYAREAMEWALASSAEDRAKHWETMQEQMGISPEGGNDG